MTINPFSPPQSAVCDTRMAAGAMPELWNPNAAVNLSLLFSPAFGAYLHMRNWEALGQPEKAATSKIWFILTLVLVFGGTLLSLFLPNAKALGSMPRILGLALLFSWYFGSARAQAQYVKDEFGDAYWHKGWGKPVAVALLATVGFIAVVIALAFGLGVAGRH